MGSGSTTPWGEHGSDIFAKKNVAPPPPKGPWDDKAFVAQYSAGMARGDDEGSKAARQLLRDVSRSNYQLTTEQWKGDIPKTVLVKHIEAALDTTICICIYVMFIVWGHAPTSYIYFF